MLFDKDGAIKRYESPEAILTEFFHLRMEYYAKRRALLIQARFSAVHSAASGCLAHRQSRGASIGVHKLQVR